MPSSSDQNSGKDPLEPVLRDVEAQLRDRLREACEAEANGISTESASEIRRLEDSLLAAAVAARQTIDLRRHIDERKSGQKAMNAERTPEPRAEPDAANELVIKLREFRDAQGQLWRAWPVTPGQARTGRTAGRYLGEFHKGWIWLEALESNARRRLPQQPEHWTELREPELCELLGQAINAPERGRRTDARERPAHPPTH